MCCQRAVPDENSQKLDFVDYFFYEIFFLHLTKVLRLAQVLHFTSELFAHTALVRLDSNDGLNLPPGWLLDVPVVRFREVASREEMMPTAFRHCP